MKINTLIVLVSFLAVTAAHAEKPEWAGKGKPTATQREEHRTTMKAKKQLGENDKDVAEKREKKKGKEKQKTKKAEQVQKEQNRGSEKGQEARDKRKKWKNFEE